jgi:hypothetical protein
MAQNAIAISVLQSALNTLNVLVGNFPVTSHEDAKILFGAPPTHSFRVAAHTPGSSSDATRNAICFRDTIVGTK